MAKDLETRLQRLEGEQLPTDRPPRIVRIIVDASPDGPVVTGAICRQTGAYVERQEEETEISFRDRVESLLSE